MGFFSWLDAKDNKQIRIGEEVYLLIPKEFVEKYGTNAYKGRYDGYGHVGIYDVYEEVALWNRDSLRGKGKYAVDNGCAVMGNRPYFKIYSSNNVPDEDLDRELHDMYDDEYIHAFGELRGIGIDIACADKDNKRLPYPIKISHYADAVYEDCKFSKGDPKQGCD